MGKFVCQECDAVMEANEVFDHICNVGEVLDIPDRIGEVIGWRSWDVGTDGFLYSLNGAKWRPNGYLVAECLPLGMPISMTRVRRTLVGRVPVGRHVTSEIPVPSCTCGIYAAKTRSHLQDMSYNRYSPGSARVIGEVAMSGKVIPGTQGYRAARARPLRVFVPYEMWRLAQQLEARYSIPVVLDNTLV